MAFLKNTISLKSQLCPEDKLRYYKGDALPLVDCRVKLVAAIRQMNILIIGVT